MNESPTTTSPPRPPRFDFEYFISRASAETSDVEAAREVKAVLEHLSGPGSVRYQDENFELGSDFFLKMDEFVRRARHCVILHSAAWRRSEWCQREWASFEAQPDRRELGRRVVLISLNDDPVTGLLASIVRVSLAGVAEPARRAELIRDAALGKALHAPRLPFRAFGRMPNHNAHFTGREDKIAHLVRAFHGADTIAAALTQQQALQGPGGVGKTTLARAYIERMSDRYMGAIWLAGHSREAIDNQLADIGSRLGHPVTGITASDAALDVLDRLGQAPLPWLIVYDNVESQSALDGLLRPGNVHTLVTSRLNDWHGTATSVDVDVFTPREAFEFLVSRAQRDDDDEGALRLSEALGFLPLALDHAGAYCRLLRIRFDDYRDKLATYLDVRPNSSQYPVTVAATFRLAIEKAAADCPAARIVMEIASYMAPECIPVDLIHAGLMREVDREQALARLAEVSLIRLSELEDGTRVFDVHRLVQVVVREDLRAAGRDTARLHEAVRLSKAVFGMITDLDRLWALPATTMRKLMLQAFVPAEHLPGYDGMPVRKKLDEAHRILADKMDPLKQRIALRKRFKQLLDQAEQIISGCDATHLLVEIRDKIQRVQSKLEADQSSATGVAEISAHMTELTLNRSEIERSTALIKAWVEHMTRRLQFVAEFGSHARKLIGNTDHDRLPPSAAANFDLGLESLALQLNDLIAEGDALASGLSIPVTDPGLAQFNAKQATVLASSLEPLRSLRSLLQKLQAEL